MINRKKVFVDKAIKRELADMRESWGVDGDFSFEEYEEQRELNELREELMPEIAEA